MPEGSPSPNSQRQVPQNTAVFAFHSLKVGEPHALCSPMWGWGAGWKATVETTGWKAIPQLNILPTFRFPVGAVACLLALT